MVGLEGKIPLNWMMTGGTPIFGNLPILSENMLLESNGLSESFLQKCQCVGYTPSLTKPEQFASNIQSPTSMNEPVHAKHPQDDHNITKHRKMRSQTTHGHSHES